MTLFEVISNNADAGNLYVNQFLDDMSYTRIC